MAFVERQYFCPARRRGPRRAGHRTGGLAAKKKLDPLAYVVAGLKALRCQLPKITARVGGQSATGELVLIGNGHFYGGPLEILTGADLRDGLLDLCVLPRANWLTLLRCAPGLLARRKLHANAGQRFRAPAFELTGDASASFQLDGEWVGHLPATFSVAREQLRVIIP